MDQKRLISQSLGHFSQLFYELATYDSLVGMLKARAIKTPEFQEIAASSFGITFSAGNPNVLSSNFGHITQKRIAQYVAKNGILEHFSSELVLSYLYQFWETRTRPELEELIPERVTSDVFGDLRLIRNALQHERHKPLYQSKRIAETRVFVWVANQQHSSLTGDAFYAIAYAIGLELNRLRKIFGEPEGNASGIPSFFQKNAHFGLLELG